MYPPSLTPLLLSDLLQTPEREEEGRGVEQEPEEPIRRSAERQLVKFSLL